MKSAIRTGGWECVRIARLRGGGPEQRREVGTDSMAHPGSGEMFKGPVEGTGWEDQEMRRLEPRQECQLYPAGNGAPEQVFLARTDMTR